MLNQSWDANCIATAQMILKINDEEVLFFDNFTR